MAVIHDNLSAAENVVGFGLVLMRMAPDGGRGPEFVAEDLVKTDYIALEIVLGASWEGVVDLRATSRENYVVCSVDCHSEAFLHRSHSLYEVLMGKVGWHPASAPSWDRTVGPLYAASS